MASPLGGRSPVNQRDPSQTFQSVADRLCHEMVTQLAGEHSKETKRMFDEVCLLRNEMERVKELLEGYLAREKVLREMQQAMVQQMKDTHATFQSMHGEFSGAIQGQMD